MAAAFRWPRVAALLLAAGVLAACAPAARGAAAAPPTSDGARQPWLIMWRRGVNGTRLWERLCPSVSLPEESPAAPKGAKGLDDALPLWDAAPPLNINCMSRYDALLNGFAGAAGGAPAGGTCGGCMGAHAGAAWERMQGPHAAAWGAYGCMRPHAPAPTGPPRSLLGAQLA